MNVSSYGCQGNGQPQEGHNIRHLVLSAGLLLNNGTATVH